MEEFGKVAVGDVQKQFLVELKDKIKHKFNQIRQENEKVAEVSSIFKNSNFQMMSLIAAFFMKSLWFYPCNYWLYLSHCGIS